LGLNWAAERLRDIPGDIPPAALGGAL